MLFTNAFVRSLLLDTWLIDPAYAESMVPLVLSWLDGDHTKLENYEKPMPTLLAAGGSLDLRDSGGNFSGFGGAGSGSAVIPIRGAITKYDGLCSYGVESYMQWIDDAERSTNVESVVLLIDSHGGQSNASFLLADRIARLQKPSVAYVDAGMAASGAYLILSAADVAYAATPVDMFGSIGAMISITDFKSKLEGSKTWEIYSRLSSEKNAGWRRLRENNDPSLLQDMLDVNVQHFVDTVKKNRPGIQTSQFDPFKGATYTADVALSIGLIDGIGTIQQAISASQSRTQNKQNMDLRAKLISLLGLQSEEDPTPEAPAETNSNEPVAPETPQAPVPETPAAPSLEDLQNQISQLTSQNQTLASANKKLTGDYAALQTKMANAPAAAATTPAVSKEEVPEGPQTKEEALSILSETDVRVAALKAATKRKPIKQ